MLVKKGLSMDDIIKNKDYPISYKVEEIDNYSTSNREVGNFIFAILLAFILMIGYCLFVYTHQNLYSRILIGGSCLLLCIICGFIYSAVVETYKIYVYKIVFSRDDAQNIFTEIALQFFKIHGHLCKSIEVNVTTETPLRELTKEEITQKIINDIKTYFSKVKVV